MVYSQATVEMVEICEEMVGKHHDHLDGKSIAILCRDTAAKRGGREIFATAGKMSKKVNALLTAAGGETTYDFLIIIAADKWEELSRNQREALMDHELCHCHVEADGTLKMVGHDLEEFACIIHRHGVWWTDEGMDDPVTQALLFREGVTVDNPSVPDQDEDKEKKAS